ncbi:UNVERIFIED_CONTAM: hypothetical protein Sindi_2302200 [Sesamum indicum]
MVLADYADYDVWVGGVVEWVPIISYVGGSRLGFSNVDKERLYYGNLLEMYAKPGGKGLNVVVYYCLPGHLLDNELRMLNEDEGIRELLRDYKGLNAESNAPILDETINATEFDFDISEPANNTNSLYNSKSIHYHHNTSPLFEGEHGVNGVEGEQGVDGGKREQVGGEEVERDQGVEEGEGKQIGGEEGDENDSNLEGPLDDDIFENRPHDHARKILKIIRAFVIEQKRKKNATEQQRQEDKRNMGAVGWFTDASEEDDLVLLRGSNDEEPSYPVWNENIDLGSEDLTVGMKFPTRER